MMHPQEVRHAAFSPDGRRVATACADGAARVWNVQSGQTIGPSVKHHGRARRVVFSRDGQRVLSTGGLFGTIGEGMIWDARTSELLLPPLLHNAPVYLAAFTPDERWVLTESSDGTARLWHAETGELLGLLRQQDTIRNAVLHPSGRQVLTSGRDGIWRLWDLANEASLGLTWRFRSSAHHAEFSPDGGRVLTAAHTDGVMVWDAVTGRELAPKLRAAGRAEYASFSPDGKLVGVAGTNGQVRVFDAASGEPVSPTLRHDGAVMHLAFSPDSRLIATASADGAARIWDMRTGGPVTPPLRHTSRVHCVAFSPSARWLATGAGPGEPESGPGEVRLFRAPDWRLAATVQMEASVRQLAFSPDGRRIIAGCTEFSPVPRAARLLDVASARFVGAPLSHAQGVSAVAFSPDGRRAASGSTDGTARVWDSDTGAPVTPLMRHRRGVRSVYFSPDSKRLVTASGDGTARVWDAATGEALTPALKHTPVKKLAREGWMRQAVFSPDGRRLLTAGGTLGSDGEARIWELPASTITIADLEQVAVLMAGAELDSTAGLSALSTGALRQLWVEIARNHPQLASVSPASELRWHEQQAGDCEHRGQWFAARVHLERLCALQPGNPAFARRLQKAESHLAK
jgi:WD40 repeat protein